MQPVEPRAGAAECVEEAAAAVVRARSATADESALAAADDGLRLWLRERERERESETNVISGLSEREERESGEKERTPGANKQ